MKQYRLGDMAWLNIGDGKGAARVSPLFRATQIDREGCVLWAECGPPDRALVTKHDGTPIESGGPHVVRERKPAYELIPPVALLEEARVFASSEAKYPAWQFTDSYTDHVRAVLSHTLAYLGGDDLDDESKIHHLAHARARLGILLHLIGNGLGTDDRNVVMRPSVTNEVADR